MQPTEPPRSTRQPNWHRMEKQAASPGRSSKNHLPSQSLNSANKKQPVKTQKPPERKDGGSATLQTLSVPLFVLFWFSTSLFKQEITHCCRCIHLHRARIQPRSNSDSYRVCSRSAGSTVSQGNRTRSHLESIPRVYLSIGQTTLVLSDAGQHT